MDITNKIAEFFARFPEKTYEKGEILLHAREQVQSVFYLRRGRVAQYDIAPNGNEVVVNVFKPGAFFPMSSVINGTENQYFFEASEPTAVQLAPKAEVIQFLQTNPDVVLDLLSRVYRGVDGVLRRMAHLMAGDSESRLIFELLNAAQRFGEQQPDGSIMLLITEQELSRRSGLARETVSRLMQELKASHVLTSRRGGITIPRIVDLEDRLGTKL